MYEAGSGNPPPHHLIFASWYTFFLIIFLISEERIGYESYWLNPTYTGSVLFMHCWCTFSQPLIIVLENILHKSGSIRNNGHWNTWQSWYIVVHQKRCREVSAALRTSVKWHFIDIRTVTCCLLWPAGRSIPTTHRHGHQSGTGRLQ